MKVEIWLDRAKDYARELIWRRQSQRVKVALLGRNLSDGLLAKLVIYLLLSIVAYLYLQPLLYMVSTMLKTVSDLLDPAVKWIPRVVTWENLTKAYEGLQYPEALRNTAVIALTCSIVQVMVCSMTGYALARLAVPFKGLITALVLLTFLIPPQVIIIPLYVIFSKLGLLNTLFVFLIPAIFGQGLKGALFILIFRQFFKSQRRAWKRQRSWTVRPQADFISVLCCRWLNPPVWLSFSSHSSGIGTCTMSRPCSWPKGLHRYRSVLTIWNPC
ncbi:binding-protein-dependent transport systems inner membrane component [Paenibacillus sp. JCM 10914]|nr:binding-protein-dependent transport systems inner membrane component [Paenibacillus sp. JCM 10914]